MVNLVAVALLLAPIAAKVIEHDNFQLLCKKQDGTHIPLANTKFMIYPMSHEQARGRDSNIFQQLWNKGRDLIKTEAFRLRQVTNAKGFSGHLTNKFDHVSDDKEIAYEFLINCNAGYRSECPAIDNICKAMGNPETYPFTIHYDKNKKAFQRGYCSFYAANNLNCGTNYNGIDKTPMNKDQFCAGPDGNEVRPCVFTETSVQSTNQQSTNEDFKGDESHRSLRSHSQEQKAEGAQLNNWTLLCKKADGTHIPMADTPVIVHQGSDHFFDKLWNKVKDTLNNVTKKINEGMTDGQGKITAATQIVSTGSDRKVYVKIGVSCQATYRHDCVAVDDICKSQGEPAQFTFEIDYSRNKEAFTSGHGVCSLTTAAVHSCAASKALLEGGSSSSEGPAAAPRFSRFSH